MRHLLLLCIVALPLSFIGAQGSAFGVKGGLSVGTQRGDNPYATDALFAYHGIAFIESLNEDSPFSLFAQAGYHVRGSARRNQRFINLNNGGFFNQSYNFEIQNLALTLGGKSRKDLGASAAQWYYMIGVRGEYTLGTNFEEYDQIFVGGFPGFFPDEGFIRKINYGVTVGGGLEFPFAELAGGILELTVNPDFSRQYEQPPVTNVTDPFTGQPINLAQRRVINMSVELSLGIRLLHKVEYID
mgnify:CR=1 FL=1